MQNTLKQFVIFHFKAQFQGASIRQGPDRQRSPYELISDQFMHRLRRLTKIELTFLNTLFSHQIELTIYVKRNFLCPRKTAGKTISIRAINRTRSVLRVLSSALTRWYSCANITRFSAGTSSANRLGCTCGSTGERYRVPVSRVHMHKLSEHTRRRDVDKI